MFIVCPLGLQDENGDGDDSVEWTWSRYCNKTRLLVFSCMRTPKADPFVVEKNMINP